MKKRKPATEEQKAASKMKRLQLCEISTQVKSMMEENENTPPGTPLPYPLLQDCERVNQCLIALYSDRVGVESDQWHMFREWKKENLKVKKGEKGFAIWGKPREMEKKEDGETSSEAETGEEKTLKKYKAFPLCYLFHIGQTEALDAKPEKVETVGEVIICSSPSTTAKKPVTPQIPPPPAPTPDWAKKFNPEEKPEAEPIPETAIEAETIPEATQEPERELATVCSEPGESSEFFKF